MPKTKENKPKGAETLLALKEAFAKVDKKKKGSINVSQFKQLLSNIMEGSSESEDVEALVPELFDLLDANKDGKLTEKEFCGLAMYGSIDQVNDLVMTAMIYAADKDENGWITAAELKEMIVKISPPEKSEDVDQMVQMLMMMMSSDDDTKVAIDAVVDFFVKGPVEEEDPKEKHRIMFRMVDINKDGSITTKELAKFFGMEGGLEEFLVKEMIAEVDKNGDGRLNYEEFCAFLDKEN